MHACIFVSRGLHARFSTKYYCCQDAWMPRYLGQVRRSRRVDSRSYNTLYESYLTAKQQLLVDPFDNRPKDHSRDLLLTISKGKIEENLTLLT